jgi:hypothetical protein
MGKQRSQRAILAFNAGEWSPRMEGRADLERSHRAAATLENVLVETYGRARARPGLQYIAGVRIPIPLTYVSREGVARMYGITEFGDLSDPPKKYLELISNRAEINRSGATPAFSYVRAPQLVRFTTSGTKTVQLAADAERPGVSGIAASDTLESFDFTGDYTAKPLDWTKAKRRKYTTGAAALAAGEAAVDFSLHTGNQGDTTTTTGDTLLRIAWPVWKGTYWEITGTLSSAASVGTLRMALRTGNADPGDPETAGVLVSPEGAFTIYVPPDSSVRFWVRASTWGTEWNGSAFPPNFVELYPAPWSVAGMADAELPMWFYFPAGTGYAVNDKMELDDGVQRYEERLALEDTLTAAIQRGSEGVDWIEGVESVATTISITGGTTAESHSPMDWEGRIVTASRTFTGLTAGNRYSVDVLVRTNTIGLTDYAFATESFEFVTGAASYAFDYETIAAVGQDKRAMTMTATDLGADPVAPSALDPDVMLWYGRILQAGGTITGASLTIANDLVLALKAASLWDKITYLLPLLGDFAAILVPLRDRNNEGNATNTAFVAGDFSEATGLQGNGSSKYLIFPFSPNDLGTSQVGGLFWWELGFTGSGNVEPIGCYNNAANRRFVLDLRSTLEAFRWGTAGTDAAITAVAATSKFYHGERRSSTDRELYRNGASIATDAGADSTTGIADNNIIAWGNDLGASIAPWPGRGGCAGCTNGTMSDADALALYEILRDELMTPTTRI